MKGTKKFFFWMVHYDKHLYMCVFFSVSIFFGRAILWSKKKSGEWHTNHSRLILSILDDASKQIMDSLAHLRWRSSLRFSRILRASHAHIQRKLLNVSQLSFFAAVFFVVFCFFSLFVSLFGFFAKFPAVLRCDLVPSSSLFFLIKMKISSQYCTIRV